MMEAVVKLMELSGTEDNPYSDAARKFAMHEAVSVRVSQRQQVVVQPPTPSGRSPSRAPSAMAPL